MSRRKLMRAFGVWGLAAGLSVSASALLAQQDGAMSGVSATGETLPIVEAINVELNQYLQKETYLYYISTKPGERFDALRLKEDFHRLWETGFLEDLLLDVKDGQKGKIVTFRVRERKRIAIIDYRGSKAITKSSIEDKLKEKEAGIKIDTFYDIGKARKVEAIIKEMLEEAGRSFGTVRHEVKPVGIAGVQLSFVIDDGPKTRVKEIVFLGNRVYSDGVLRRHMKGIKERKFWNFTWLLGKTSYTAEKWRADQEKLREFYLNHGYVTVSIGDPNVTYFESPSQDPKKKPSKWIRLEIPVAEGEQYRMGELKFEGLTVFKEPAIRALFKIQTGQVYKEARISKGYEKLRDLYGIWGYFNWTPLTKRKPDYTRKVVDVTLVMQEEKRFFVGRISFKGNDMTRDKVIRREIFLNEGDVFNTEALKMSIKRVNQLGYFKPIENAPELKASAEGEEKIDVSFKVEEQNRNQFMIGGGKGAYEGYFINSSFATSNFLGGGETVSLTVQSGARIKQYQFAMTEPYFLDRPITAGFEIYKRRLNSYGQDLQPYVDDRLGASVTSGIPISRFARVFGNYTYEIVKIEQLDETQIVDDQYYYDPYYGTYFPVSRAYAYRIEDYGKRYESRLTPSIVYNTVDNPIMPRSGIRLSGTFQFAGGPLGGTMNYLRPDLEAVFYKPHLRRTALGMRVNYAMVHPFGKTAEIKPETGRDALPFYHRFALGGESHVRGYEIYSIWPSDSNGQPRYKEIPNPDDPDNPGRMPIYGDRYLLFNAEYYLDIMGTLRLLAFFDAGQAYTASERIDIKKMKISTGLEARFQMPVVNLPIRLMYYYNPNRGEYYSALDPNYGGIKKHGFKFAMGSTF